MSEATHCFIGRTDCGCVRALVVDGRDTATARETGVMIRAGLAVDRLTIAAARRLDLHLGPCPHQPALAGWWDVDGIDFDDEPNPDQGYPALPQDAYVEAWPMRRQG